MVGLVAVMMGCMEAVALIAIMIKIINAVMEITILVGDLGLDLDLGPRAGTAALVATADHGLVPFHLGPDPSPPLATLLRRR